MTSFRDVRALYTDDTIRVYQAYRDEIANAALTKGTFAPPFKRDRMTWIKPSFLWMMYRAGWGRKPGQQRILAVDITRDGFEWALRNSCLSDIAAKLGKEQARQVMDSSPVRVQWDPERDLNLKPLAYRSIQIGLSRDAVDRYINEWITNITDITATAHEIETAVEQKNLQKARSLLPEERSYPLPNDIAHIVEAGVEL